MPKDRAANRERRKDARKIDHGPLLRLTQTEITRRPVQPRKIELKPLTEAQRHYDAAIFANTIVFGVGPAGTGKTWWAAMRAAEQLQAGEIERIIVTRPAVEAGESLGFLPGELDEKYEPYFRPVKDAFEEFFGSGHLEYLLKSGKIEARPLAFLRGATLKNCWVIADEMQNATVTQMKLLLTRIGENAKFIVNGDPRQCDLPNRSQSGLTDAQRRLGSVKGVASITFERADIVRSGMAQAVVEAYEADELTIAVSDPDAHRYVMHDAGVRATLRV